MLQMAGTATGSAVRSSFNRKTMKNDKRCSIAWARFDALRRNIPSWLKREQVAECHWIVDAVQSLGRQDFRQSWPNSFYELNWGGGFQHQKGW